MLQRLPKSKYEELILPWHLNEAQMHAFCILGKDMIGIFATQLYLIYRPLQSCDNIFPEFLQELPESGSCSLYLQKMVAP